MVFLKTFFLFYNLSNEFKENVFNYLNNSLDGLNVDIHISIDPDHPRLPFGKCNFKSVDILDIDTNSNHSRDALLYIRYFKPKELVLVERNFDDTIEIDPHFYYYKELFDISSNSHSKLFSQNIEKLELVDIINVEELYYILSNTTNNLKSLIISLCFETLVYNLSFNKLSYNNNNSNNDSNNIHESESSNIMGDVDNFYYFWKQIYNIVSNHQHLKHLTIESKEKEFNCNHYVQTLALSDDNDNNNSYYNYSNSSLFYFYQQYHQKEFNNNFLYNFGSMISNNSSLETFSFLEESDWKLQLYNYIKSLNINNKALI
ncbi:expressed protein [Dictyostelium purpureum]|uniref:Expressed protein n=1 Tax=Dictyostelium purpureum TaxID=5786 RepID=F0ZTH2_DICPU|nr:uncharacterized protein DICPUDRAFT_89071 [Dictyostelium purpureum]EGC32750.1 expressed protein [Dictyostelium purpureum]|eukprot:XP_003290713.1 expressed protein [Dictyostelium purpureum]